MIYVTFWKVGNHSMVMAVMASGAMALMMKVLMGIRVTAETGLRFMHLPCMHSSTCVHFYVCI